MPSLAAHLATDTDAPVIRQHLLDLLGPTSLTLRTTRMRMAAANIITAVSEHGYCEFKINAAAKAAQVTALLPLGASVALLDPLLQLAVDELWRLHPESANWDVWAIFWRAVDENGEPDQGHSQCLAWQRQRPDCRVYYEDGRWVVSIPVRLAISKRLRRGS